MLIGPIGLIRPLKLAPHCSPELLPRPPSANIHLRETIMAANKPSPVNQQELPIESTPREQMDLFPLDTFAYEFPGKEIKINFEIPEFTAICPFSDFPDFAVIRIEYVPNERCVELKSLKLYINSFRNVKIFHEHVINVILEDFVDACDPLSVQIEGDFHVRGNIKTVVRASYAKG